jgi:MoaD family protein
MPITLTIPTQLRQHTAGVSEISASGRTVKEALDDLVRQHPAVQERLFADGQVRRFVNLFLNDEDVRYLDGLDTAIKDGDQLAIIPSVAGG